MQQTFPVEREPRVILTKVGGDLEVHGWDKREISVDYDDHTDILQQEGNTLMLANCSGDVTLWVPNDTDVRVDGLKGDVSARDIRRVELKGVRGDVELNTIGIDANLENIGEAIFLENISGDVEIQRASSLRTRRKIEGAANLNEVSLVEIETISGDLEMRHVEMASLGNVGGDLEVAELSDVLRCGNVGGDCEISGGTHAEINLGNIGGDLEIPGALRVRLGNTGGDVEIRDVQEEVYIGNIGSDASINGVGGNLHAGRIGGDADLHGLSKSTRVGAVAGDLELQSDFPPESKGHFHVGGDATVILPANANVAVQATVGGDISGPSLSFSHGGNIVRLVYGEEAAQLNLSVGGDLELQGNGNPRVNSASMPWWEFGEEMADLGQAMEEMGREMEQGFKELFNDLGWTGAAWADEVSRKVEEQVRKARQKAEQHARKAEEQARQAQKRASQHAERARQRGDRMRVRVNEREWAMNPDHFNDLMKRAQQAAMEGVAGALEAVERSIGNLSVKRPPQPGWSPLPPNWSPLPPNWSPLPPGWSPFSPVPPVPPVPPAPPVPPYSPGNRNDVDVNVDVPVDVPPAPVGQAGSGEAGEAPDLEQEREAILRMIAEGRITPEEGDMLLEGLGG